MYVAPQNAGRTTDSSSAVPVRAQFSTMIALSFGPLVSTSFARFAYGLLLPAMRSELELTYSQAGALNTANAVGYLIGALVAVRYVPRFGNRRLFCIGLVATVLALFGSGVIDRFDVQLFLRTVAGVGGALVFITGVVLASNLAADEPRVSATATAIYFGGAGAGIFISAIAVPWLLATLGAHAWREAWLGLAGISGVLAVFSIRAAWTSREPGRLGAPVRWPIRRLRVALMSYFLSGLGYIGYMTFVVASMIGRGATHLDVAVMWGTLGLASMVAPLVWRSARQRHHAATLLVVIGLTMSVGAAIPVFTASRGAMVTSAMLFGVAMFSVPATATDLVKTSLPKPAWGSAIAVFTVSFAVGQMVGPLFTGWLADATHTLRAGLAASAVILALASFVATFQRSVSGVGQAHRAVACAATARRYAGL